MSNELAKLKVTLEAQTSAYKKEIYHAGNITGIADHGTYPVGRPGKNFYMGTV